MLGNDYTQINDMGYGIVATNGGLIEAVSIFTYYCWISYYAINGGQIRSVSGSSAHGKYALVAQGYDPLEVPTPTSVYEPLSQGAVVYEAGVKYSNTEGGFQLWVTDYAFFPIGDSEVEVDHGGTIGIVRYGVGGVESDIAIPGIAKLNIVSEGGLKAAIANGVKVSLRANTRIVLTGDLLDVSVRPSTGLIMTELPTKVYRVLNFDAYVDPNATGTGAKYEVIAIPETNSLQLTDPNDLPLRFREGYQVIFNTTGTLPTNLEPGTVDFETGRTKDGSKYYILKDGLDIENGIFKVALTKNGSPISFSDNGTGIHSVIPVNLTSTKLRESYNYVELTVFDPGEFVGDELQGDGSCTFDATPAAEIIVNATGHTLVNGDVIRFEVGNVSTTTLPSPLSRDKKYHVIEVVPGVSFKVSNVPSGAAIISTKEEIGTEFYYGKITGRVGDNTIAVAPLNSSDTNRIIGSRFVFIGEEYEVTNYTVRSLPVPGAAGATGKAFGRITIKHVATNGGFQDSPLPYAAQTTMLAGSQPGTSNTTSTLTIRISLTRVTSHDLLDIGTGSYKETNYPNEIYGKPENPADPTFETQERTVGRVFYVTTDQYGNFKVGPFFSVDQGTGTVSYAGNIAISNLDGLGFKVGVTVSEFSIDTGFSSNALDKVPVEYATRSYIERRLGLTHTGEVIPNGDMIPAGNSGGFMALSGLLPMKGDLNVDQHKIVNLADPENNQDAVNLQSLRISKLNDVIVTPTGNAAEGQLLAFTGTGTDMVNVTLDTTTGDIGTGAVGSNKLPLTIKPGAITNAKVSDTAAIAQSKLSMNKADTFNESTGWTGIKTQADLGLAKFSADNFETVDGYVRLKSNGVALSDVAQIADNSVLGRNMGSGTPGDIAAIPFSTVVGVGGGIAKTQYSEVGVLARTNAVSFVNNTDYSVIKLASAYSGVSDNGKIVQRDTSGDFGGRRINASDRYQISSNDLIVRSTGGTGGSLSYYGYNGDGSGGVVIGGGTNATDKVTKYLNNTHIFRTAADDADAPIKASQVETLKLTTGGNTTAGTITGRWTLTGNSPNESRLQATYSADLAEYYEGDKDYPVGTVLVFGGEKEVTTTNQFADTRVAGVVSNTAAFVMYDACPGLKNLIALQGRVPVKVVGKVRKGDILVTSKIPGVAIATQNAQAGTIIGKALAEYNSDHIGTIEVAVGRN